LQADENSMFSMLLRSLISEGRIVHQTTVEDPNSRAVVPAVARMELAGMPIDVAAHRKQVARWNADLIAAEASLRAASPIRDIQRPAELQRHLEEVLSVDALAAWPRTETGKLRTRRQQLQLNSHLPAIDELLKVRALSKMLEAFGEGLIGA